MTRIGLALALDEVTEQRFTPWYWQQIDRDRDRTAVIKAAIEGRELPKPEESDPIKRMQQVFLIAANHDPDFARALFEMMSVLMLPQKIMARPGMFEKVIAASEGQQPPETPGRRKTSSSRYWILIERRLARRRRALALWGRLPWTRPRKDHSKVTSHIGPCSRTYWPRDRPHRF